MSNKKTIYIIRHGETEYNRMGIVQGSGIDSDLNEKGHQQALSFFKSYKHIPFDKVYTSRLKRTQQTVEKFIEEGIPTESLAGLNEIGWGICEGVQSDPSWKATYYALIESWKNGNLQNKIEGGENPLELTARQKEALAHILSKPEEKTVLICMHGRALRNFLCLLLNRNLRDMDEFAHGNTSLYVLEYENGVFRLLTSNCSLHLGKTA